MIMIIVIIMIMRRRSRNWKEMRMSREGRMSKGRTKDL